MMECIKTGAHAWLEPYGVWLYGDMFRARGYYVFRACSVAYNPIISVTHFEIYSYTYWFDQDKTSMAQNSTMLCHKRWVKNLGHEELSI